MKSLCSRQARERDQQEGRKALVSFYELGPLSTVWRFSL